MEGPVLGLECDVRELRFGAHPVEPGEQRGEVSGELELYLVETLVLHLHARDALSHAARLVGGPALKMCASHHITDHIKVSLLSRSYHIISYRFGRQFILSQGFVKIVLRIPLACMGIQFQWPVELSEKTLQNL